VVAAILLWTTRRRVAAWILLAALGVGVVVGVYEHFLRDSADNVFTMAASAWSTQFRVSAVLLPLVQLLGCILAVRVIREPSSVRPPRPAGPTK
jgi:hypothetical protein